MRWVQFTIPAPMAALLLDCARLAVEKKRFEGSDEKALLDLVDFLKYARDNPNAFPPTGTMASSLKTRARRVDGIRRNDGTLHDPEVAHRRKRAHRKTSRPTRHERRLQETRDRKDRNRAERHSHGSLAGDGLVAQPERKGLLARVGLGRAQGQDQNADV